MTQEYILKPAQGARDLHIDYRAELNDQQFAAVTATGTDGSVNSGPMLVIAGAGSGKTRTLTYRVAWLVEHGVPPGRILLLRFGNDFTILDREDSKDMLDACVAEAGIDTKQERFPKGDVLADIYSLVVNTDRSIEKVLVDQYDYFSHLAGPINTLREVYRERKLKANAMDYD